MGAPAARDGVHDARLHDARLHDARLHDARRTAAMLLLDGHPGRTVMR